MVGLSLAFFVVVIMAALPAVSPASVAGFSGTQLAYVADPGEVNTVTVSYALRVFTVTDTSAAITPAFGCVSVTAHQVSCDANNTFFESSLWFMINAGDMNDSVSVTSSPLSNSSANQISGGDGADSLTGGPGDDSFADGPGNDIVNGATGNDNFHSGTGADTLIGGPGTDLVTYATRDLAGSINNVAVTVSIDGNPNDGNADDGPLGARDNVATDVENLQGSAAADTLSGNAGNNAIDGYAGDDTLNGADGDDKLTDGGGGDETLNGGGGDDLLQGSGGADTMNGGTGIDTVDYSDHDYMPPPVTVTLDGVADDGFAGENDNAGSDVENVIGSPFADFLTGNSSDNFLLGGGGNDTLIGLGGDDSLLGDQLAFGIVTGGGADDTLSGGVGDDSLDGGIGADVLNGGPDSDLADYSERLNPVTVELDGLANDGEAGESDRVGTDVEDVFGGFGDDALIGDGQANLLYGAEGDDLLDGALGADTLVGGPGGDDTADYSARTSSVRVALDGTATSGQTGENDTITADIEDALGGSGADTFIGNASDNIFDGGPGGDFFSGADGFDAVDYSSRSQSVIVSLDGIANDGAVGESDNLGTAMEDAFGGSGDDHFSGNEASNFFAGGAGADLLEGAGGDDFLIGQSGADSLSGGAGFDFFDSGSDDDSIQSRDGLAEDVGCGSGSDSVIADLVDSTSDCESAHRGPPPVTAGAASQITATTATVAANVNPAGQATTAYVEIGPTVAYGTRGPVLSLPAEVADYRVTSELSNLQPGTTYHYRFVAANADGTTYGADQSFATGAPSGTDLRLTIKDLPDPATVGKRLTYILTIANRGLVPAVSVRVNDPLAPQLAFVSASTSRGACNNKAPVRCELGSLAGGASATVTIIVRPRAKGVISNTATVTAGTPDPFTANNSATAKSTVKAGLCVVPNVKGKTLGAARKAIARAHCTLGKVRLAYSANVRRGRVIAQRPAKGARLRSGAKVNLVVSRGGSR